MRPCGLCLLFPFLAYLAHNTPTKNGDTLPRGPTPTWTGKVRCDSRLGFVVAMDEPKVEGERTY